MLILLANFQGRQKRPGQALDSSKAFSLFSKDARILGNQGSAAGALERVLKMGGAGDPLPTRSRDDSPTVTSKVAKRPAPSAPVPSGESPRLRVGSGSP